MRKFAGLLALGALSGICLVGCETPPAKTVAPGETGATMQKVGDSNAKATSTSVAPTANPNYNGALGTKAK